MYEAILLFAWKADTLSIIVVRQAGAILEKVNRVCLLSYCLYVEKILTIMDFYSV